MIEKGQQRGVAVCYTMLREGNAINLKLFHHCNSWVIKKDIKASEDAKFPKRSVESHGFWIFGEIELHFRCKKIVLSMKYKEKDKLEHCQIKFWSVHIYYC